MSGSVWALILRHASSASVKKFSLLTAYYLRLKDFATFTVFAVLES